MWRRWRDDWRRGGAGDAHAGTLDKGMVSGLIQKNDLWMFNKYTMMRFTGYLKDNNYRSTEKVNMTEIEDLGKLQFVALQQIAVGIMKIRYRASH